MYSSAPHLTRWLTSLGWGYLFHTLDGPSPPAVNTGVEAACEAKIQGRVADIESGKVVLLNHKEFDRSFDEARASLHPSACAKGLDNLPTSR